MFQADAISTIRDFLDDGSADPTDLFSYDDLYESIQYHNNFTSDLLTDMDLTIEQVVESMRYTNMRDFAQQLTFTDEAKATELLSELAYWADKRNFKEP